MIRPTTALSAEILSPGLLVPLKVMATNPDDSFLYPLRAYSSDWVWDLMMDHLTVPLGPGEQNNWPLWVYREQWFIADRMDDDRKDTHEVKDWPRSRAAASLLA